MNIQNIQKIFKDIFYSRVFTVQKKGHGGGKNRWQDLPGAGDVATTKVSFLKKLRFW